MTPLFVLGKVPLKCPLAFIFEKKKNIQKSSPLLYSDTCVRDPFLNYYAPNLSGAVTGRETDGGAGQSKSH